MTVRDKSFAWVLCMTVLGVHALPACGDPDVVIGSDTLRQPNTTGPDGSDGEERDPPCAADTDCEDDSKPYCRDAICVACLTNADCEDSEEPVCSFAEGECVSQ